MDKLEKTDENLSAIVNKAYIIALKTSGIWLFSSRSNCLAWLFLWKRKPCPWQHKPFCLGGVSLPGHPLFFKP